MLSVFYFMEWWCEQSASKIKQTILASFLCLNNNLIFKNHFKWNKKYLMLFNGIKCESNTFFYLIHIRIEYICTHEWIPTHFRRWHFMSIPLFRVHITTPTTDRNYPAFIFKNFFYWELINHLWLIESILTTSVKKNWLIKIKIQPFCDVWKRNLACHTITTTTTGRFA